MSERENIVVKYGSDSVTNGAGMDEERVAAHVDQLAALHDKYGIIVVSSGAVAVGRTVLPPSVQVEVDDLRGLAMAGSAQAFIPWQASFYKHGIASGQLLITHHEIADKKEGSAMHTALSSNLSKHWITIANENDALSDEELRKLLYGGDNDGLAKHIAEVMKASRLLLLTDKIGLMDEVDKLVPSVATPRQYKEALALVKDFKRKGRGGMKTKVRAAWEAAGCGVDAYIGHADNQIEDVFSGLGTYFPARR